MSLGAVHKAMFDTMADECLVEKIDVSAWHNIMIRELDSSIIRYTKALKRMMRTNPCMYHVCGGPCGMPGL